VFFLRRPSDDRIRGILRERGDLPFTYPEVGATRREAPRGYPINHHRIRLGRGEATFRRAIAAVRAWRMYDLPWTVLCWPDAALEPGVAVAVLVRHWGFWSVNPCRIVYRLEEEEGEVERFGFAFGTLPGHSESGEERFTVEWRRGNDEVWYEIYTFARGQHPLARLTPPLVRYQQRRFGRESTLAMRRAVGDQA
jgi:uncharacterized protein (UPF0548 family)